jgi:hypothetical protein
MAPDMATTPLDVEILAPDDPPPAPRKSSRAPKPASKIVESQQPPDTIALKKPNATRSSTRTPEISQPSALPTQESMDISGIRLSMMVMMIENMYQAMKAMEEKQQGQGNLTQLEIMMRQVLQARQQERQEHQQVLQATQQAREQERQEHQEALRAVLQAKEQEQEQYREALQAEQRMQNELKQEQNRLRAMLEQKIQEQGRLIAEVATRDAEHTEQVKMLMQRVEKMESQLDKIETKLNIIPCETPSYAEVARTPPSSQPSNLRTFSGSMTPSTITDTIYCTIDTSRVGEEDKPKAQLAAVRQAIEKEIRETERRETWRCVAVTKDPKNINRIRVTCRDEAELQKVKEAAQKTAARGARLLRDQLYSVKVDNANRSVILDEKGKPRPEAIQALSVENGVHIAKIDWLSRKDNGKAYGSMVIHVTRGTDAARLLDERYFHVAGESAYTRPFEPRNGPVQCYNCQQLGHKAFSCAEPQVCGKCAGTGHHHSDCQATVPKCVPCGGPHESFSKNCRVLYPARHG